MKFISNINDFMSYLILKGMRDKVMFQFLNFDYLTDGEIDLIIKEKVPANEEKGYVPAYSYIIVMHGKSDKAGRINLRIGSKKDLYYAGHIGYEIDKDYRGNHYAAKACEIVKKVALAHGLDQIIITCNPENIASRKTCERVGGKLKEIVDLPTDNEMYISGERQKCIYEITLK